MQELLHSDSESLAAILERSKEVPFLDMSWHCEPAHGREIILMADAFWDHLITSAQRVDDTTHTAHLLSCRFNTFQSFHMARLFSSPFEMFTRDDHIFRKVSFCSTKDVLSSVIDHPTFESFWHNHGRAKGSNTYKPVEPKKNVGMMCGTCYSPGCATSHFV